MTQCPECGAPYHLIVAAAKRAERAFGRWWDNQNCSKAHDELTEAMRSLRCKLNNSTMDTMADSIAVLERAVAELD